MTTTTYAVDRDRPKLTRSRPYATTGKEIQLLGLETLAVVLLTHPLENRDDRFYETLNDCIVDVEEVTEGDAQPQWLEELYTLLDGRPARRPDLAIVRGGA